MVIFLPQPVSIQWVVVFFFCKRFGSLEGPQCKIPRCRWILKERPVFGQFLMKAREHETSGRTGYFAGDMPLASRNFKI
jgi:hypothetical protein